MGLSPINIHLQHGHEDYFLGGKGRALVNIFTEPHAFFLFHPFSSSLNLDQRYSPFLIGYSSAEKNVKANHISWEQNQAQISALLTLAWYTVGFHASVNLLVNTDRVSDAIAMPLEVMQTVYLAL